MNVSLTNELETFIDGLVSSGMYSSSSEVVRDGLRLLKDKEESRAAKLDALRADVRIGVEQIERGEAKPLDLDALMARGRRRLGSGK